MAEAKLRILLFAGAREAAGKKELAVSVAVADEQVSGAQLMQAIIAAEPTCVAVTAATFPGPAAPCPDPRTRAPLHLHPGPRPSAQAHALRCIAC